MKQVSNPKIVNAHLRIKDASDLKNYLDNYFQTYDFECDEYDDENLLAGYFGDVRFEIYYERGKKLVLKTEIDCDEEFEVLKRALSPVMWYKDKNVIDDHIGPIAKYSTLETTNCEWDYVTPLETLQKLAFGHYKDGCINNIDVSYKGYTIEDFKQDTRYGAYTGTFSQEALDDIQNFNEFDIFCLIKSYIDREQEIVDAANLLNVDVENRLEDIDYQVAYLEQQLKRFGVDPGEPTEDYEGFSVEAEAWYRWWEESYEDIIDSHPEILEKVFEPVKDKVMFRPKGNFKDLVPTVIKERREETLSDIANISKGEDFNPNSKLRKILEQNSTEPGGDE